MGILSCSSSCVGWLLPEIPAPPEITPNSAGIPAQSNDMLKVRRGPRFPIPTGAPPGLRRAHGAPCCCRLLSARARTASRPPTSPGTRTGSRCCRRRTVSWGGDGDGEPHPSFRVGRVTRALPACGLGTAAASPAETKILTTLVRESNGLYTVVSTLFSKVTREDRNSLFHCTVHYWLQGQMRTKDSPRVNVTVFCESGAGGCSRCCRGGPTPTLPAPSSHRPHRARGAARGDQRGDSEGRG